MMTTEELTKNLKNREWRLNNLYWVKDEQGNRVKFKLNKAQQKLFNNLWYFNVILKARQLGITSFFCILYLDDVVFNGYDAGLIAHTLQDATKIFDTKIRYAWENLPDVVRNEYKVDFDNVRELKFTKGKRKSSIYVGTSLRSGTVQRLHVSELATLDQKYPKKSKEIKSGAFATVHKGQVITVESTAKGSTGIFAEICQEAMDIKQSGEELSEMDWKFFFFPWWQSPEYRLDSHKAIPREIQDYFNNLDITLDRQQKQWYYTKYQTFQDTMKREYPSTPAEAFEASIEGAYYNKQMNRVLKERRITSVPYEPLVPVDTWWDLGISKKKTDAMSIVFTQDIGLEVHIIDFYSNSGEGLGHYKKILDDKPYTYGKHYAPHDIEVSELSTGKTRLEMARKIGINFQPVPRISLMDGIHAVRVVLGKCWFDAEKTDRLLKALKAYRKEWDDKREAFKDHPLKDWTNDPADAFRMMAVGHKDHQRLGHYDSEEEELRRIKEKDRLEGDYDPFNMFPTIE